MQHEAGAKKQPPGVAIGQARHHQESGRHQVEGAQARHGLEDALLGGAQKDARMDQRHHQVAQAEGEPTSPERGRDGEGDHQETTHPDQQQQSYAELARWDRVGQPGVAPVHPPDVAEDQQHLQEAGQGRILGEQAGQLGDGEHEDQIEEQFERGDVLAAHGRAVRGLGGLHLFLYHAAR